MSGTPARYFRGQGCCDGKPPVWGEIFDISMHAIGGELSADAQVAVGAVRNYGGTFHAGHPPQLVPMEHTNLVGWNRPIMSAEQDSWGAPFDRNLPRLTCFADLPSLPNPDLGPQNGLPHHQQTLDYLARERAKQVPFTEFRIDYDEATGQHRTRILWCEGCSAEDDPWGDFCDDLSQTFTEMAPVIRGVAMICSYVPVLGTGAAFLINATTSLVEGENLDAAFLDGIGGALPGQPASGMAFAAARSLVNGDRIDKVGLKIALASMEVDAHIQDAVAAAIEVAVGMARGSSITELGLEQIRAQLPDSGKRAMDVARRACNGENVGGILSSEAMDAARTAFAKGEDAINTFVAEAGFQDTFGLLPEQLQGAIRAGIVVGAIEARNHQFIGTFGSVPETNAPVNESYLQKGHRIVDGGAKYGGVPLSDILHGKHFSVTVDVFDALNGVWNQQTISYKQDGPWAGNERPITDGWRRGFMIALAACEGCSVRGPGQTAVYQTMAEAGGRDGFDAGQAVAWWLTTHDLRNLTVREATETRHAGAGERVLDALANQSASAVTRAHRRRVP